MEKRVLAIIALLLLIAVLLYAGYRSYDAKHAGTSGAVYQTGGKTTDRAAASSADNTDTIVYPSSTNAPQAATPAQEAQPASAPAKPAQAAQPEQSPTGDFISPNPPNGMTFSGKGRYQLYRQGNITWRLDTETGRSCVLFATDEEWAKPRVYNTGCGKN